MRLGSDPTDHTALIVLCDHILKLGRTTFKESVIHSIVWLLCHKELTHRPAAIMEGRKPVYEAGNIGIRNVAHLPN